MEIKLCDLLFTFWKLCDCKTLLAAQAKSDQSAIPFANYTSKIYQHFFAIIQAKTSELNPEQSIFAIEVELNEHEQNVYQSINPLFIQLKSIPDLEPIINAQLHFRSRSGIDFS